MNLTKAIAAFSFFAALTIGAAVAYVANPVADEITVEELPQVSYTLAELPVEPLVSVRAANLVGSWKGTWGYGREFCTIDIKRVEGNKFYGALYKDGAVIAIEGTFHADDRRVFFRETKVVKLGSEMAEWSLGTNSGAFSPNGKILTGTGTDRWGTYNWDASKD